ncbi:MAG: DUF3267 domain-containing protein [Bacteroidales bacterium]
MRFILNRFPEDPDFVANEEWVALKESSNLWVVQLQALPFAFINAAIVILLMRLIGINFDFNSNTMLLSFLVFIPIHELIHALFFPESLKSKNVYLGFTFKGFAPFAAYIGEIKRNTFIKVLLAPFIIISIACFFYLLIFGRNELIEHIFLFNAISACADCLGVFLFMIQVPKGAIMKNKGIRSYWRK